MKPTPLILLPLGVLWLAGPAMAYVGPGLGAGVVASVLGVAAGVLMLLVGTLWYPLKRLLKRFFPRQK